METLTPENLKHFVCMQRGAKRGAKFEKHANIAQAVTQVLSGIGAFHHGDDNLLRFFNDQTKDLHLLRSRDFEVFLSQLSGLNGTEEPYKYVYRHLENLAHLQPVVPIHTLTWFAEATGELRRFMGRGQVLRRFRGGAWEPINNGADGVIFHDDPVEPCEPDFESIGALNWLREQTFFSRNGDLTFDDRWDAYLIWLIHQHMPSLRLMRLILAAIGLAESRKTSLIRNTGRVLLGPSFTEISLSKHDAFQVALSNNAVTALDNWDKFEDWFKNAVNLYVTGAHETVRELFTTADQRVMIPRAILMISSNSPKFRATDVSQRMLIEDMEKPAALDGGQTKVKAEHKLKAEFAGQWPRIMGELLNLVGRVADSYGEVTAPEPVLRAADYEEMAFHYYRVMEPDRPEASRVLIKKLMRAQSDFAAKDDPLVDVLRVILDATWRLKPIGTPAAEQERSKELKEATGQELIFWKEYPLSPGVIGPISSPKLARLCAEIGEHLDMTMPWKSSRGFGTYLTNHVTDIETQLGVRITEHIGHARDRAITLISKANAPE